MQAARAVHCKQHGLNNCKMSCYRLEDAAGKDFNLCAMPQQVLQHSLPDALL